MGEPQIFLRYEMKWCEDLYCGQSVSHKVRKIKWKIKHKVGQFHVYVIALPSNLDNLFELIPARELLLKAYPTDDLKIVGLAGNYDEALEVAGRIISQIYCETGKIEVLRYFEKRKFVR